MDPSHLQDLIAKGMGAVARITGETFTVYRPCGPDSPTDPCRRGISLTAAFTAEGNGLPRAPDYGEALWWGSFDTLYTREGDYLVGGCETYYVASQTPGLPVQCVLTNRIVTVIRPDPALTGGYSGLFASQAHRVIAAWPASLLQRAGRSGGEFRTVPREHAPRFGSWVLLLPKLPVDLQVADVITDDLGASYVAGSAEQSRLGWRLSVRQVSV